MNHQLVTFKNVLLIILIVVGISFLLKPRLSLSNNSEQYNTKINCGYKPISNETYEQASYISLAVGFSVIFLITFLNNKKLKNILSTFALLAFSVWVFIFFTADYDETRRILFNYKTVTASNSCTVGIENENGSDGLL